MAVSTRGSGSLAVAIAVKDEFDNLLDGVACWVTADQAGALVVAGTLYTDSLGVVTFTLDAGTYYLWRQRGGLNFDNPLPLTVSG